jgi:hypothetical protein
MAGSDKMRQQREEEGRRREEAERMERRRREEVERRRQLEEHERRRWDEMARAKQVAKTQAETTAAEAKQDKLIKEMEDKQKEREGLL